MVSCVCCVKWAALIPGERAAQLLWEGDDLGCDRVTYRFGATPCERRAVLHSCCSVAGHRW